MGCRAHSTYIDFLMEAYAWNNYFSEPLQTGIRKRVSNANKFQNKK